MKILPEQLGHDPATGRNLLLWPTSAAADVHDPTEPLTTRPFVCLLVWDAATETVDSISKVTDALFRAGCVYLCTWGRDCDRVHDIADEGLVMMTLNGELSDDDDDLLMTTWHDSEPLDEALWFFLRLTTPAENYVEHCRTGLVLTINQNPERISSIRDALMDPGSFSRQIEDRPDYD